MRKTLFGRLDAEWQEFVASPSTTRRYTGWQANDPSFAPYADLARLVEFAQTPGHPAASDDALRCLASRSQTDAVAARALLQCVLYALPRLATRFRPAVGGDAEEIASVVIGAAYERIRTYPIERRPRHIAANIVLDTRQVVSRTLCRPRITEVLVDSTALPAGADAPAPAGTQVIELVGEAVRSGKVGLADARLIVLTRVFDVPVEELAADHHCLPHSLRRRRLRAEAALADAVA